MHSQNPLSEMCETERPRAQEQTSVDYAAPATSVPEMADTRLPQLTPSVTLSFADEFNLRQKECFAHKIGTPERIAADLRYDEMTTILNSDIRAALRKNPHMAKM